MKRTGVSTAPGFAASDSSAGKASAIETIASSAPSRPVMISNAPPWPGMSEVTVSGSIGGGVNPLATPT